MTTPQSQPSILIVDDDKNTRDGLDRALRRSYNVILAESAETAVQILVNTSVDVMLTDLRMPGMDGLTLLQRVLAGNPRTICILLTAYGSVETAVEAMKLGAYDFLTKPVNLDHLDILLKRAIRSRDVESENQNLHEQLDNKYGLENIVGNSAGMQQVFDIIRQVAPTQATVLIQGESGTGKELAAHALHRLSTRSKGPFVAVHCASLSPTLLESELFGHEKGAFTNAISRRRGRFELADGGTLFLDEISEIDPSIQVTLLRVLEEHSFERVGGDQTVDVDIRLIAATNRNLRSVVDAGEFREDLFFRLDVVSVTLPPLRERLDDIPVLCDHFLREFCARNSKEITGMNQDVVRMLAAYPWPGNVRELRNTIEKMVVLSRTPTLSARDVPQNIRAASSSGPIITRASNLADAERSMIYALLKKHGDNRTKAAQELGISRRTLHRKLNMYRKNAGEEA